MEFESKMCAEVVAQEPVGIKHNPKETGRKIQVSDKECYDFLMSPQYFFSFNFQFIHQISPEIQV